MAALAVYAASSGEFPPRAGTLTNEASAIGSVRTINSAQATFAASCGGGGFATTLDALATPPSMGVPFISPDLVDADAAPGKSGYLVNIVAEGVEVQDAASTCNEMAASNTDYLVTATPISPGTSGQRAFASDMRGAIYQDNTGATLTAPLDVAGNVILLQ